jgi:hypothetical protein
MNPAVLAQAHQLRNAVCILAVGLDRHGPERITDLAGLKQDHWQLRFDHRRIKPLRQRPSLQADRRHLKTKAFELGNDRLRLAGNTSLLHYASRSVHDAEMRDFQRNVDSGIISHGGLPRCLAQPHR